MIQHSLIRMIELERDVAFKLRKFREKLASRPLSIFLRILVLLLIVLALLVLLRFNIPSRNHSVKSIKVIKVSERQTSLSTTTKPFRNHSRKASNDSIRKERNLCIECIDAYLNSSNKVIQMGEMSQGYANRIYAFLNVFSLGIVTNRSVVCDWQAISEFIRPLPFRRVVINEPVERFLGNETTTKDGIGMITFPNVWKLKKKLSDMRNKLTLYQFKYADLLKLTTYETIFFDFVCIRETMDRFVDTGLIRSEYIEAAKDLFTNEATGDQTEDEKIEIAYRPGFDLAHTFLKHIWRPNKRIIESIKKIVKENFTNQTFVIGIHFRTGYLDFRDVEPMANCALEVEKRAIMSKNVSQVKWYVSADQSELISYLKKKYPNKIITGHGDIKHIMGGGGYERAILDNEMLSLCHELIVTGGSSFGMLAAMRMGKMPLHFNGGRKSQECFRSSLASLGRNVDNNTPF